MNIKEAFHSRRFKYGALSTAISAIFIVLIIIFNVVASLLTDKFPLTIDLTPNSAFKLSQESIDFVRNLSKDVSVYVLANEKNLESSGDLYTSQIKSVIDQYSQYNSHISTSYVDIVKDPTFVTQYSDLNLSYNDVLITCGTKSRKLSLSSMFNISTNQYTGQQSIRSSKAEQLMTAAIMGVTSDSNVKVAFLTGHEEAQMTSFQELLTQNNFEISTINLTTDEIPGDIDVLFMLAPQRDPDNDQLQKLDTFLENGQRYGKMLFYAADAGQVPTPNLDAFLSDWGVAVGEGSVAETDTSKIFNYNPYFCTVEFTADDYTDEVNTTIKPSMPFGRPLEVLYEAQSGYLTQTLLSYSDTAAVVPVNAASDWQPAEADLHSVPALVRSTYLRYDGLDPLQSHVFVASSASSMENALISSKSVSNADYYLQLLNTVTERGDVISIAPKELGGSELGITQLQATMISSVLIYVLPILIVVIGLIIWIRRRHK
ncbi:MAG: GldG family protein [Provencibacterium sp.]|jgi:ABC-2 type transport system permease protein|nr:GldG family protein [Provencibacterium sp.]